MIGVYDSGAGGLSVWRELFALMPEQDYVYVADTAYCPYGEKPVDVIRERAEAVSRFLINEGADIIVVACNTATAAAISHLRASFDIPFVGMEPAVKPAVLTSKSGVVGVIATANTLKGSLYHNTLERFGAGVKVIEKAGTGLVEAVENGSDPSEPLSLCLREMLEAGADAIVLGCTHYPFLEEEIRKMAGPGVNIINPAPAVAKHTRHLLYGDEYSTIPAGASPGRCRFISTGTVAALKRLVGQIAPHLTDLTFEENFKI